MHSKAVVDTLKDRIAEKVKTCYNTVGKVEAELLVNKVANRIAVIRVKTLGQKLPRSAGLGNWQHTARGQDQGAG